MSFQELLRSHVLKGAGTSRAALASVARHRGVLSLIVGARSLVGLPLLLVLKGSL